VRCGYFVIFLKEIKRKIAGAAGGRNVKKIKNQKAKIKNVEPLRGAIFD
jgi:ribosomal protein L14E/L6E/L27E